LTAILPFEILGDMKVLFLDIDGVLNRLGDAEGYGATKERVDGTMFVGLDPDLLEIYKDMLARLDVIVVLSSTWRLLPELCEHLEKHGVYFHDMTICADAALELPRGIEIQLWLDEHPDEVEKYAILDDVDDMLEHQMPNFFQTNPRTGLTQRLADRVVAHFTFL
jgi:hypothetical protein